jgi:hypothetical protein
MHATTPHHTDFRGALDEVRGDAPNVAVREAAKELMTAVFDTSAAATGQRMAGYGNSLRYLHMLLILATANCFAVSDCVGFSSPFAH